MTAVEWLIDKIAQDQMYKAMSQREWLEVFEQAKEIEKEQRLVDYNVGYSDALCNHIRDGENYVNETSSKA